MKVLIIDDSQAMRIILRNQLAGLGIHDIIEAADGKAGLEKLKISMPVDVVTLDINMPVMGGITCLKEIRANKEYSKVKIVIVTSESEKACVVEAVSMGANNYIVKPFTPEMLKQKLGLV
jgi:two-component system chemotaxis response regulator CheY